MSTSFQSLVEKKLTPVGTSGKDIIYICPKCGDKSGHLYINYEKNKYNCFRCGNSPGGVKGRNIANLIRSLGIDINYDYDKLYSEYDSKIDDIISMKKSNSVIEKVLDYSTDLNALTEYYYWHIQPLTQRALDYLYSRGLTYSTITSLQLCEGVNRFGEKRIIQGKEYIGRDYSGRIMIPSLRRDGLISFYLGRDYIGDKPNKYSNAPKEIAVSSEDVWSLDIIDSPIVVICEGVFTSIAVNNAVGKYISCATYGKSIASKSSETTVRVTSQGEKLLNRGFKVYIMFYDKDALEDSYKNAEYLYDRGADVRIVKIPEGMYGPKADAADMTKEEIIALIKDAKSFDLFSKNGLT